MPRCSIFAELRQQHSISSSGTCQSSLGRAALCSSCHCCECTCGKKTLLGNMQSYGQLWPHSMTRPHAPSERRHYTGYAVTTQVDVAANLACKLLFLALAACGECAVLSTVRFCLSKTSQLNKESTAATSQRERLTQRCCLRI